MMSLIVVTILLFASILFILLTAGLLIRHRKRRIVVQTSEALKALDELNYRTRRLLSPEYSNTIQIIVKCRSKTQYDGKSLHQCLCQYLAEHFKAFSSIYEAVVADKTVYQEYSEAVLRCEDRIGHGWHKETGLTAGEYRKIETRLFIRGRIPAPSFRLDVRKTYVSPKKRNHYQDQGFFYVSTLIHICDQLYRISKKKEKASAERKLMTNALRYQVLKRDGFCCTICGRSQKDGVVLHIDHIKPIAKGGKTVPSNLRVLCADCNLGKGSSYREGECN